MSSSLPSPLTDLPIRRLTRDDLVPCADLSEDRGWPRDEERWALLLAAGTGYGIDDPDSKGLMASCVTVSYGPELAAVGMLLVAGRHARRGVGRYLMQRVIETAGGTPLSLYATSSGRPLYEDLGFIPVGRTVRLSGTFRPTTESGSAGSSGAEPSGSTGLVVRPASAGDLRAMVQLDSGAFGLDRTHLLTRLPAFADHLRVAEEDGELIGYAALSPSADNHAVGPLIARDTATAKALVTSLAAATDRPLRVDIDARHDELLDWAGACGLRYDSETTEMILGGRRHGDRARCFGPLSLATG
ncbi:MULTISPECIES: GNAT family N-acetyltransferase [unclassified Streptomyces]|uniref:GNAT family N-acetyltransferase n=1 Tax=unclassified Streptomyces TaxID=2593676 RepID=UPI00035EB3E2|nr:MULTISPECIES: GNAT family N-acetyltransferase [unclassified Streptomyces]MYY04968.1 GNAT family N-acetyltransferase [Streptomyces sp. SID4913]